MCTMRVAVLREMTGTRETGWTLWDGKQVKELTSRQIKDNIKAGKKVCGLTLGKNGELVLDKDGFYCNNIMEHRHCGNYTPMVEGDCMANLFYIVIGSHEEAGKTVYDCISTKFEQVTLAEADVRAYLKIGVISAGCKLNGDNIELAPLEFGQEIPKPAAKIKPVEPVKEEGPVKAGPVQEKTTKKK